MTSRTHTPEDIKKIDDEFKEVLSTRLFKEKKEWVGLTDDEVEEAGKLNIEGERMLPYSFARAVEAKLKEKNS